LKDLDQDKASEPPGPGAYSVVPIGDSFKTKNTGKCGVFGSTERRFV
jgi:hypothetical protein